MTKRTRLRNTLTTGLKVAVSGVLLWFVINRVGVDRIIGNVATLTPMTVIVAISLSVLGVFLSAWKWQLLLVVKDIRLSFLSAWVYYYIGQFFNTFMPSVIGGDTARLYYLYSDTQQGSAAASSIIVERVIGLYSMLCIVSFAMTLGSTLIPERIATTVTVCTAVGLLGLPAMLFSSNLRKGLDMTVFSVDTFGIGAMFEEVHTAVYDYRNSVPTLAIALLISVLFRVVLIGSNFVVAQGLGIDISPIYFFVFIPVVEFLLFIPLSIQGFGVRESAYLYLFSSVGVPEGVALTFGVVMQVVLRVINNLIGGAVYLAHELRSAGS